jgi:hypothetical protein
MSGSASNESGVGTAFPEADGDLVHVLQTQVMHKNGCKSTHSTLRNAHFQGTSPDMLKQDHLLAGGEIEAAGRT